MLKRILSLGIIILLGAAVAAADEAKEKKDAGLMAWLKDLQRKIEQIVPKKELTVTTGVAGVRGTKEESAAKLYWKGKQGEEPVTEEELTRFKRGVDLALEGDRAASTKELEEFMKLYPDSALVPDAVKTLELVKVEQKAR